MVRGFPKPVSIWLEIPYETSGHIISLLFISGSLTSTLFLNYSFTLPQFDCQYIIYTLTIEVYFNQHAKPKSSVSDYFIYRIQWKRKEQYTYYRSFLLRVRIELVISYHIYGLIELLLFPSVSCN